MNSGVIHTSKGKEKFNHSSAFNPIHTPIAILTRNCIPIPAYFISSLLVSFRVFKWIFYFIMNVVFSKRIFFLKKFYLHLFSF